MKIDSEKDKKDCLYRQKRLSFFNWEREIQKKDENRLGKRQKRLSIQTVYIDKKDCLFSSGKEKYRKKK